MPLLMASLQKDTGISVHVLPIVITQLKSQSAMTPTQFRDKIWPAIINLCAQKELPAQSLFIMLSNEHVIVKFVSH